MFDAVGIISKNVSDSLEFYKNFDLNFMEFGDKEHYEATTSSGVRIMIDSEDMMKKLNPNWSRPESFGVVLCFKLPKASDVDELFSILKEKYTIQVEPWDAFWGQRYASVLDPDGNQVDIFAPLEN